MDHSVACKSFTPPPPQSMAGYFDTVTGGQARDVAPLISIYRMDKLVAEIRSRPDLAERAALLNELETRVAAFGRAKGYLEPPPPKTDDERSNIVTTFIIKDVLGLSDKTADQKAIDALKKEVKKFVKDHLNKKGQGALKLLEVLYALCNAKTGEEALRILAKAGSKELADVIKANWDVLLRLSLKTVGVSAVVRNRLIKLIALRISWASLALSRLRWLNPILVCLEIALTPESTASDATMERLAFLTVYSRLFSQSGDELGRLIQSCAGADWQYKMSMDTAFERSSRTAWRLP